LTTDFLFPAFSTSRREPLFYSNQFLTGENNDAKEGLNDENISWGNNLTLAAMVTGSSADGVYFSNFKRGFTNTSDNTYGIDEITGGGSISSSPALYSYFLVTDRLNISGNKISATIVGSLEAKTDKISTSVNPLQWASRIFSLAAPVKEYTQEYMLEHILRAQNQSWNEYTYKGAKT